MGVRINNLKAMFSDAKMRTIFLLTLAIGIVGLFIGYVVFKEKTKEPAADVSIVSAPDSLQGLPGSVNPTAQYAKLLEEENLKQAQIAEKTGGSAIPTIIRETDIVPGQLANLPIQPITAKQLGLSALTRSGCDPQTLAIAIKQGATVGELRDAGCSAQQLTAAGFTAQQLQQAGFSACDLLSTSGIDPKKLKQAGFSAGELRGVGFNACQLTKAGFTPSDLMQAGYTPEELKGVGITPAQIAAAGYIPTSLAPTGAPGSTASMIKQAGCSVEAIAREKAMGVSASLIRLAAGCSATELKAGGYTPSELKNAGFTAGELRKAGYSLPELKQTGFTAGDLAAAGFTPAELKQAGFSDPEIRKGVADLKNKISPAQLAAIRETDCGVTAIAAARQAGVTAATLRALGCSIEALKAGGYTIPQLKDAGFTAGELSKAGSPASELKAAGFTPGQLRAAGFTARQLADAGYTPQELKNAGFPESDLREVGYIPPAPPPPTPAPPMPKPEVPSIAVPQETSESAALRQAEAKQQAQIRQQQQSNEQQQIQSAMASQAGQLFTAWKPATQVYMEGEKPRADEMAPGRPGSAEAAASSVPPMLKAGSVLFAVLETSVNSDEPGPILATVVGGPYKGAKLIGSLTLFGQHSQEVMLTFNVMTLPDFPASFPITAVAIDEDTARTGLSSYTNNHYMLRYGTLFASAFLEGYGQAFIQTGQTIIPSLLGPITVSSELNPTQQFMVALGNVGNAFGQQLQPFFNMQPTVHVYSGTGVGILFTQDVAPPSLSK